MDKKKQLEHTTVEKVNRKGNAGKSLIKTLMTQSGAGAFDQHRTNYSMHGAF